jgi:hypothetical protein
MYSCGIVGHDDACLCDVTLPETPTPIAFGLTELWHGEAIARALGFGVPWDSEQFAEFGEALTKAYDIWARKERRGERIEGEVLRLKACELLQTGVSMVDVAYRLDVAHSELMHAMTNGQHSAVWDWDDTDWLVVEAVIYDDFANLSRDNLAIKIGVHHHVVEHLSEWYGVKVNQNGQTRLDRMKMALLDGLHPNDAEQQLRLEGWDVTAMQLYKMRKRMAERGEVSFVIPLRRK